MHFALILCLSSSAVSTLWETFMCHLSSSQTRIRAFSQSKRGKSSFYRVESIRHYSSSTKSLCVLNIAALLWHYSISTSKSDNQTVGGQVVSTPFAGKWLKFSKALCFAADPSDLAGHRASERDKGKEREVDDGIAGVPRAKKKNSKKRIKARGCEKKEEEREGKTEVQVCS